MEIRFISSLTADDEKNVAPAVLKAVCTLLDQFPIAYTIRIETIGSHVFQHAHTPANAEEGGFGAVERARAGAQLSRV